MKKIKIITKDVKQWFENANTQWEVMVGARSYYTTAFQNQCLIKNYQFGNLMSQSTQTVSSPSQCANYEFYNSTNWTTSEPVYNTYWDPMVQQNDGVVTVTSQKAFPGAYPMEMIGSNHQQMKNDSRTRDVLLRAYGGEVQYFLTNLK
jgi:hypothetical protein